MDQSKVLLVEPFYGGSHKQLIDLLHKYIPHSKLVTLKPKKWHWRARCSALVLSTVVPKVTTETTLFCSSVTNLAELVGLRADLRDLRKVLYFHENQLAYPVRSVKERDVQFPYNQIISCLVADVVLFNSMFNMCSFLDGLMKIIKLFPDYKPKELRSSIEPKCKVLYYPIHFPEIRTRDRESVLHIIWPHRWEFDKSPELFIDVLCRLGADDCQFFVSFLGETFSDVPDVFVRAKEVMGDRILHWGYLETKEEYYDVLSSGHVVVSTALHEFFGVATLEAVFCGCYPLVPNRVVYPEIYPTECLYDTEQDLYDRLKRISESPNEATLSRRNLHIDFEKYSSDCLLPQYLELLQEKE